MQVKVKVKFNANYKLTYFLYIFWQPEIECVTHSFIQSVSDWNSFDGTGLDWIGVLRGR